MEGMMIITSHYIKDEALLILRLKVDISTADFVFAI